MNYFTELSIGITNAWIGTLVLLLLNIIVASNKKLYKRMGDISWYTSYEKKLALVNSIIIAGLYILSIWIPLKTGTPWLYTGIVLFIAGLIASLISLWNYASTPEDETITKGMYKISRNPLYLFNGLMIFGMVTASLSLFLFILWLGLLISTHFIILAEEQYCLKTYGDSYREYMQKSPRYFLFF